MLFRNIILASSIAFVGAACTASAQEEAEPSLAISRLDCGDIVIKDLDTFFTGEGERPSGEWQGTDSCYLIRHGDELMIWDAGLPAEVLADPIDDELWAARFDRLIVDQLADNGIVPEDIDIIGISHMHLDHVGQVGDFPNATLVVGRGDFVETEGENDPFPAFRGEGAKVKLVDRQDFDIFGDGSVIAVSLPGHTPDHLGLLVKLDSGPVLLSGDLYLSREAWENGLIPSYAKDRADLIASFKRFEELAVSLNADVVIQHDLDSHRKVPRFPAERQ